MKSKILLTYFSLIIVFLIAALPLAGCAGAVKSTDTSSAEATAAEATTAAPAAETTAANTSQVICKNNKFVPDSLTVKTGTTVTWVNQDGFVHTVTSGTSPSERSGLFDSGNLSGGETFSFTFDQPGTYDYFCIPHFSLGMIGKIIVTD